jgi:hypothetical protein
MPLRSRPCVRLICDEANGAGGVRVASLPLDGHASVLQNMGKTADKDGRDAQRPANDVRRPGHVEVDARGRNVWRWAREGIDSTSVLLKGLENKDLALEPTQKVPVVPESDSASRARPAADARTGKATGTKPPQRSPKAEKAAEPPHPARRDARRDRGGGFDPYNSR